MQERVDMFSIFRRPPKRPNGEEVHLQAPKESQQEMNQRLQKDEERLRNQRACKHLKDAIILQEACGQNPEKLINDLITLSKVEEYFEGRDGIPEFIEEFKIHQAISKTRREIEEIAKEGLTDRARRSSKSPSRPRINMIKVLKKEAEEEEEEHDLSKYWKITLIMMTVQLIVAWLYDHCNKRKKHEEQLQFEDDSSEEEQRNPIVGSESERLDPLQCSICGRFDNSRTSSTVVVICCEDTTLNHCDKMMCMSPCYEDHKWRVESAIRRRNRH